MIVQAHSMAVRVLLLLLVRHAQGTPLSWERKELSETCWCQNDRIFEGFLDFPKYMNFWISEFLDF